MEEKTLGYHLCPRCFRATPAAAGEIFCPNDGERLLAACPACGEAIASPYARHCTGCGRSLGRDEASQEA